MTKTGLKCPKCHQYLNDGATKGCPNCGALIRVAQKTCCRYLLEQEKIGFQDVKKVLSNWPILIQEEFVRAVAVFNLSSR